MNEFITNPEDCEGIYVEALKRGNKELVEQNARLQSELDKYIRMASDYEKTLKQIASENDCYLTVADEVLKKWENK